jgi:hypothetical protein
MFCSCFVVTVLFIFIFVCTSVGLLTPGESPIAVVVVVVVVVVVAAAVVVAVTTIIITTTIYNVMLMHCKAFPSASCSYLATITKRDSTVIDIH